MPTQAEAEDYQHSLDDVQALSVAALVAYWTEQVAAAPVAALDGLRDFILDTGTEYGLAAAATTVDFYTSVRPPAAPTFTPTAVVPDDVVPGGSLNWATEPLLGDEWEKALDKAAAVILKATKQAAIDTMGEATAEDPLKPKYARFPQNDDPCAWCVLRASRGAIYWAEETAERGDHTFCHCAIVPVFPGEPLPYLRKPYMAQYLAGASEADGPGRKALLSGMRRANGTR